MVGNTPAAGSSLFRGALFVLTAVGVVLTASFTAFAQEASESAEGTEAAPELGPVTGLRAGDVSSDDGASMYAVWDPMAYDDIEGVRYVVELAESEAGPYEQVAEFQAADEAYLGASIERPFWMWQPEENQHYVEFATPTEAPADAVASEEEAPPSAEAEEDEQAEPEPLPLTDRTYYVRVRTILGEQEALSDVVTAVPSANWFDWSRLNNAVAVVFFSSVLLLFLELAKRRDLYLRRIPGLSAVDEALGRATEMGKPVYFLTGRMDIDNISTVAATIILGEIAKKTAAYDVTLRVPHTYSVTMAVCREITRESYAEAGRLDAYQDEINFFITEEQFSYAAAVNGMMLRERPGAVFYMGYYYAESLLMAEAGSMAGAIQIAGTDAEHQLPFFVTTCDYTLIGEELYAASAYLSRKPELVGTLRGLDVGKAIIMAGLIIGTTLVTLAAIVPGLEHLGSVLDLLRPS